MKIYLVLKLKTIKIMPYKIEDGLFLFPEVNNSLGSFLAVKTMMKITSESGDLDEIIYHMIYLYDHSIFVFNTKTAS